MYAGCTRIHAILMRIYIRPSHACIVSERLNLSSKFFHHKIASSF